MQAIARTQDTTIKLVPGGDSSLAHLSDSELLSNTRCLVGKTHQLFAALLIHLAEIESRGIHRARACSSLYTYCIYELRFSEDAAARRAGAAKLIKRFPLLIEAIANGELHLTGLLMLGPHLTPDNHLDVLARAKFRTKKELAKLVRELHPLPRVPDLIEPLGPNRAPPRTPSWQEFTASLAPPIRELPSGERPREWANDVTPNAARELSHSGALAPALARVEQPQLPLAPALARVEQPQLASAPAPARVESLQLPLAPALARVEQYQMQFSTTEEHVQLVERAQALLARQSVVPSLGELHLQAMRLLLTALEKQ